MNTLRASKIQHPESFQSFERSQKILKYVLFFLQMVTVAFIPTDHIDLLR